MTSLPEFQPAESNNPTELVSLLQLGADAFRSRYRHTPMWRSKRRGLLRNAAIVLGNQRWEMAIEALCKTLSDEEPLIRSSSAWALGQIGSATAAQALRERASIERDEVVAAEIDAALEQV